MKIAILSGLYERGGAEKAAREIARGLKNLGHEVFFITTGKVEKNDSNIYYLSPANFFWYGEIGEHHFFFRLAWHLIDCFNIVQAWRVRNILKKEQPTLVWSHNLKGLGWLIPRLVQLSGFKHIHTLHDIQLLVPSGQAKEISSLSFYGRLTRFLFPNEAREMKVSTFISERSAGNKEYPVALLRGAQPERERGLVSPEQSSGVNTSLFGSRAVVTAPSRWLLELHQRFGFFKSSQIVWLPHAFLEPNKVIRQSSEIITLVFLGQLEESKGLKFLLEALEDEPLELLVAGDGPLQDYLKNTRARYVGFLDPLAMESLWEKVDFLVVPSLILENSPTVILEAFSHGVPVIASNIGGIPELVQDGENGFLFEPGDSQSLLQAIVKAKAANYAALSQKAIARYQVLCCEYAKILGEIIAT